MLYRGLSSHDQDYVIYRKSRHFGAQVDMERYAVQHESEEFDEKTVTDTFILYDRAITRREKATDRMKLAV